MSSFGLSFSEKSMLTFSDVMAISRANTYNRWLPHKDIDTTAAKRITDGGYIYVDCQPKFKLNKASKVFTIGSCFARNIEEHLTVAGLDVLTRSIALQPEQYETNARPNAVLNKYNTHSIYSQFYRSLNNEIVINNGFIETNDGKWLDPHASHTKPLPFEEAEQIFFKVNEITKQITVADVVIITLGLNEVWFDSETNLYLNRAPTPILMRKYKDRFKFLVANYAQSYEALEKTLALVKSVNPNIKVILTVSPVPLGTTMTNQDVIVANTYSKSLLRVCAQEIANEDENVDYFPSYEIVTHSARDITWLDDQLHVLGEAVAHVTSLFVNKYIE
jgi:hypothetical protein